jgi:hypothetical protein
MPGWSNCSSITDLPIASVRVEGFEEDLLARMSEGIWEKNIFLKVFFIEMYKILKKIIININTI